METMKQLKARHQEEVNTFEGIFFAFNNEQLNKGMEKVGLNKEETSKIASLGAGGFIRKDRIEAWIEMLKRQKEEAKQKRKEEKTINIVYVGIDNWNRAVFKSIKKPYRFYGNTCKLFDYGASEEEGLQELDEDLFEYFGTSFGCEPMGTPAGNIKIMKGALV